MGRVPDRSQVKVEVAESLSNSSRNEENDPGQETAAGQEGSIQNQINLPPTPTVVSLVLSYLDLRDLKQVRLVCKSWLLEAQIHMERKGIVVLGQESCCSARIQKFIQTWENKLPGLPQPFKSLDVDLHCIVEALPPDQVLNKLFTLCPPLLLTRFSPENIPMTLILPFIMKCSSSLEYLRLFAHLDRGERYRIPPRSQDLKFPNLRHLVTDSTVYVVARDMEDFPALVSWITRASPNLDSFEVIADGLSGQGIEENKMLQQVEIRNVRTLSLAGFVMERATLEHFVSIPFTKLQNLCMTKVTGPGYQAMLAVVLKSTTTLKKLHLWDAENPLRQPLPFPVCPVLRELQLELFPGWTDFVSRCFPSLQDFAPHNSMYGTAPAFFRKSPRFVGVRTLRLRSFEYGKDGPMEIFKAFPRLERLHITASLLLQYCKKKRSGGSGFVDLLQNLKHVELEGNKSSWKDITHDDDFSLLAELKGIETLTVSKLSEVIRIPVQEMPCLKVLRFAWVEGTCRKASLKQLLKITSGLEKAVITNCCSVLRQSSSAEKQAMEKMFGILMKPNTVYCKEKKLLLEFFKSAPNAVCGCKEQTEMLKPFWIQ